MGRAKGALRVIPEDDGGLTLEDLFADTVTFEVTVSGRRLEVTWAPARFTPILEDRAIALTQGDAEEVEDETLTDVERERQRSRQIRDENTAVREFLAGVLVSWTLRTREGTPVGVDADTLRTLPPAFLKTVFGVMTENAGPKDETEPPSDPTSSQTA